MPRKTFSKRKKIFRRKRTGRRGRRSLMRKIVAPNNALGFPTSRLVKMRYVTNTILDAAANGVAYYNMRANDLFDPDAQSGGHQPLGFDQWSQFYHRFTVIGSKITVRYNSNGNGVTNAVVGVLLQNSNVGVSPPYSTLIEQGKGKWRYVSPTVNGPNVLHTLRHGFSAKKWFNIANIKDNSTRLSCTSAASPTDQAFYSIWAAGVDQTTDPLGVQVLIQVDYLVMCSEPIELTQS